MSNALNLNMSHYFFSKVQVVKKSLYLSSPYIKNTIATFLYEILRSKPDLNLSIKILTRIKIQDLIEGASDLEAFEKLLEIDELPGIKAEVRCISNLHAKVYIFDEDSAIVTSSNLTPSGLKSNVEYGIEVTDSIAIRQMLNDMETYWHNAETLNMETIKEIWKRMQATESIVKVNRVAQGSKEHSPTEHSSITIKGVGKRLAPLGKDVEIAALDNLRNIILPISKYSKRSKVVFPITNGLVDFEDEISDDSPLINPDEERTVEIESSYSELEDMSVEQLISELKDDSKQRRKRARMQLQVLFVLDNSCIMPYIAELSRANLKLCCSFLRHLPDNRLAVRHLLHILNAAKTENGSLPFLVLKTLNDIAPDRLFSFLCQAVKEPLSTNAKRHAIEELKNAIVKLNLQDNDSAIETLKNLTEDMLPKVRNAAYIALGQIGNVKSIDFLRDAFRQAKRHKMSLETQMSILQGLIAAGITPDDELMFVRLTYNPLVRFRAIAIRALRQNGEKYWQRISAMAESDRNVDVRTQAVRALVNIDATKAYKVLIKLKENEPDENLKNTITSLMHRHEQSIRSLPIDEEQLLQSSLSGLQSSDKKIRIKGAKALGRLKHVSAIQPLCETLRDEDGIVRTVAAEALGSIGNNLSVLPLIEVLESDSHTHARAAAAKALGLIGDKRAIEAIGKGLKDKSGHVRKWCWTSISKLR
ncbi:hypothetical protein C6501_07285 [Candidatus Poribacteria bacterium]|nr:MAG: hypothetical protein C6501_07285 [Candidatus Poribacteria bacterium]